MPTDSYSLQVLLLTLSGFVIRYQADVIAYLVEENRILKERMKGRRVRLTDDQRHGLAAKAKVLGSRTLRASIRLRLRANTRGRVFGQDAVGQAWERFTSSATSGLAANSR